MRRTTTLALAFAALVAVIAGLGASPPAPQDSAPAAGERIAEAAHNFLAALDETGRDQAVYALSDDERFDWHFVPRGRNGVALRDMSFEARRAAHDLLMETMSSQGYLKASAVIELERILGILENRPERRDPEGYFVTIFGSPGSTEPWAWRFEGHHLSLNFSSPDGALTVTGPAFFGANPATVPSGPRAGWRPLGREEDLGRALVRSLSEEQREIAVIAAEAPDDIITGNDREAHLESFEGLPASEMTDAQRAMLMALVAEYVGNMEDSAAQAWTERIAAETRIHFAWAGPTNPGEGHYYRVHAPSFLIEYDNTQNDANHVHSVWRDLENDFGGDALARHYARGH